MTKLLPIFILLFAGFAFSQTNEHAVARYSVNDKLIGLANLYTGLSDCSIRSVAGKVKDIDRLGNSAEVTIKVDKKTKAKVIVPLDRVVDADRRAVFRHLITKNNVIRVSGYACNPDEPFSAFSVDRVY
ncbi:MAG: hypothetical protein AB7F88_19410 [Pyrinomonadaceae bacterium]